jgi:hypothetical protein
MHDQEQVAAALKGVLPWLGSGGGYCLPSANLRSLHLRETGQCDLQGPKPDPTLHLRNIVLQVQRAPVGLASQCVGSVLSCRRQVHRVSHTTMPIELL